MQILFLGTSAGWPLPRLGCKCHICSSTELKDKRFRPSILINRTVLIDAPPDIYHELNRYKVDPADIAHILLTHAHDDHIMGLYDLAKIYNLKNKITLISVKNVLTHTRNKMGMSLLNFKILEVKPFKKLEIENNTFAWFIPVVHPTEAYAIKIKSGKPILYAPEFRRILPSSKIHSGDLELAIIDGSSKSKQGQARGHENITEGIRLGKEINAKKILFTNIGHKTDTHVNLVNFVKRQGGNKFDIAFDGLEIKV